MSQFSTSNKWTNLSFRLRIVIGVTIPMIIGMTFLSALHYYREQQLLTSQTRQFGIQLGDIITDGITHAMQSNNPLMIGQIITKFSEQETIMRLQIVNSVGEIRYDSAGTNIGNIFQQTDSGCVECHQSSASERPQAITLDLTPNILRIATPIYNEKKCHTCHDPSQTQLGLVFIDSSLNALEEHFNQDLRVEIFIMVASVLIGAVTFYLLLYWFVVRRVEKFDTYMESYADGDFSVRMPTPEHERDELDKLVTTFNHLADELEQRAQDEQETQRLRLQAVSEERERIARELHDGMAQLIGFVRTKASAIRLLLKNNKTTNAITNLTQLEEAAENLSVDVREAILGLKTSEQIGGGLVSMLQGYVDQFRRLSDLQVHVSISPAVEDIPLSTETELHLLRIVQEALSNARKHAIATEVTLTVTRENGSLRLVVADNGIGFDSKKLDNENSLQFGLRGMRDRVQEIGGSFEIESELGSGSRIIISLPLAKEEIN